MIEQLLKLQQVEKEIDELKQSHQVYPRKLTTAKEEEALRRRAVETARAQLETQERERRDFDSTLKLEEERLKKSKAKLSQIKKEYEYHAMVREIESTKRSNAEVEEKVLQKIEEIEKTQKNIEALEALWKTTQENLAKVEEEVNAKISEYDGILRIKEGERQTAEAGIDRALLSRFRMIRQRRHSDPIVAIMNYACQGCFMNIPPQQVNEMMRHQTIQTCPNCHRMVYVESTATS